MHQTQEDAHQAGGSLSAAISNAVVRLTHEYTGRGPTKAKTTINHELVATVLKDTMTKAERSLVDNGKGDLVLQMRREFQQTMCTDLVSAVEMLMERKVIAFMSDNHIDPDMAVEIFVLEPKPEPDVETASQ